MYTIIAVPDVLRLYLDTVILKHVINSNPDQDVLLFFMHSGQ